MQNATIASIFAFLITWFEVALYFMLCILIAENFVAWKNIVAMKFEAVI